MCASKTTVREAFDRSGEDLHRVWDKLHRGDREPWPDGRSVARLRQKNPLFANWLEARGGDFEAVATGTQDAWAAFHSGQFPRAMKLGASLGGIGAVAANKAAAIYSLTLPRGSAKRSDVLLAAIKRGETAIEQLPEHANAHYMLALALGRHSQDISIIQAVAAGLASRVRQHLERTLALEPHHAEAHVALGLYHAELIGKLGGLAAALTYGASKDKAAEHFRQALKLAPASPIVRIEYANGILLLDPKNGRERAETLYEEAAAMKPGDAMEQLDVERAQRGLP